MYNYPVKPEQMQTIRDTNGMNSLRLKFEFRRQPYEAEKEMLPHMHSCTLNDSMF